MTDEDTSSSVNPLRSVQEKGSFLQEWHLLPKEDRLLHKKIQQSVLR